MGGIFDKVLNPVRALIPDPNDGPTTQPLPGSEADKAIRKINDLRHKGFIDGVKASKDFIERGERSVEHSVEGKLCDIAVGGLLAAAIAVRNMDGEQEVEMTAFVAVLAAAKEAGEDLANNIAIATVIHSLAYVLAEVIWTIHKVRSRFSSRKNLADFLDCVMSSLLDEYEKIVATDGAYLEGMLVGILTSAICEGSAPQGCSIN